MSRIRSYKFIKLLPPYNAVTIEEPTKSQYVYQGCVHKNLVSKCRMNPLKYIFVHGVWRLDRKRNLAAKFQFREVYNKNLRSFSILEIEPRESFDLAGFCIMYGLNFKAISDHLIFSSKEEFKIDFLDFYAVDHLFAAKLIFNGYYKKDKSMQEIKEFCDKNKIIFIDEFYYKIPIEVGYEIFAEIYSKDNFLVEAAERFMTYSYNIYLSRRLNRAIFMKGHPLSCH